MILAQHYVVFSFRRGRYGAECEITARKRHPELMGEVKALSSSRKRIDFVIKAAFQEEAHGLAKLVRKFFRDRHSNGCVYFGDRFFVSDLFETIDSINKPGLNYDDVEDLDDILDDDEFEIAMHDHDYAITLAPWDPLAEALPDQELHDGIMETRMEELVADALGLALDEVARGGLLSYNDPDPSEGL